MIIFVEKTDYKLQVKFVLKKKKKKERKKEKGLTSDFQFENVDFWDGITRNKMILA